MNASGTKLATALWVLVCAWVSAWAWGLSVCHQLNTAGYWVCFGVGLVLLGIAWRRGGPSGFQRVPLRKRRWLRTMPLMFALVAGLALLGGALYPPCNYDAMAYRLPRVLHWLSQDHWHWIHTHFPRLNSRSLGMELVFAPLLALAHTDRLVFLLNAISFLLLPGLAFSILTRLGVRRRVAWYWMWILPTGYCFVIQAGSNANDLFGATLAAIALDSALRARESKAWRDIAISTLAAALMTSAKASNLPLLLPWLIALAPALRIMLRQWIRSLALAAVALLVSYAPMAALNAKYCGDWTGLGAEPSKVAGGPLWLHVGNNAVLLTLQNVVPPVFPLAGAWNRAMDEHVPHAWRERLLKHFETEGAKWHLGEMQVEEWAGLGFGVCWLLILSWVLGVLLSKGPQFRCRECVPHHAWWVLGGSCVALLAYMAKSGLTPAARLTAPYYLFVLPLLLLPEFHARLVRTRWWRAVAVMVMIMAAGLVIVTPARPLWPATRVLGNLGGAESTHPLVRRAWKVYSTYAQRWDAFAPAREMLPPGEAVVGVVTFDDPEASLWRPYGQRRFVHITPEDTLEEIRDRGVRYILVSPVLLERFQRIDFPQWLERFDGTVVDGRDVTLRVGVGTTRWYLVKLPE